MKRVLALLAMVLVVAIGCSEKHVYIPLNDYDVKIKIKSPPADTLYNGVDVLPIHINYFIVGTLRHIQIDLYNDTENSELVYTHYELLNIDVEHDHIVNVPINLAQASDMRLTTSTWSLDSVVVVNESVQFRMQP